MTTKVAEPSITDNLAMTRAVSGSQAIVTPEAFAAKLTEWQQQFNVLTPFTTFTALAPGWAISGTIVQISPNTHPDGPREVYGGLPFLKKRERDDGSWEQLEVAIAKKGLRKLAEGAGISTQTYELPTNQRFYWKVKAVATYRGIDGTPITREATKEWDLRDGSPQLKGWTADQVNEGRKHGLRNCEARAINAAIRECGCGIDQKYTVDQLKKPFIAIRVSFQPDMSDPEVRRMVTGAAMQATSALYGGPQGLLGGGAPRPIPDDPDDLPPTGEPRVVGAGTAAPAPTSGSMPSATTSAPAADAPPCEGAVRIVKVKDIKTGKLRNGGTWTLWKVTDSAGVDYSTLEDEVASAARRARDDRAWVECITETKGEYTNLVELAPAGQSPRLPVEDGY